MEVDRTRMCGLLVGLPAINVLAVDERSEVVVVYIESRVERPGRAGCGAAACVKDRPPVELVDLPVRRSPGPARVAQAPLVLPRPGLCDGDMDRRGPADRPRPGMTDRAGRWACAQVGRLERSMPRSPPSWAVTSTSSTTPLSPAPHPWRVPADASGSLLVNSRPADDRSGHARARGCETPAAGGPPATVQRRPGHRRGGRWRRRDGPAPRSPVGR